MRIYNLILLFFAMVLSACGSYRNADRTIQNSSENSIDSIIQQDSIISLSFNQSSSQKLDDTSIDIIEISLKDSILYPSKVIHISKKSSSKKENISRDSTVAKSSTQKKSSINKTNNNYTFRSKEKENYLVSLWKPIIIIIFLSVLIVFMKKYD